MEDSGPALNIINRILSVIHPALYEAGKNTLDRLQTQKFTKDLASKWASVFTGISVIGNRRTILHKDQNGDHAWYDLVPVWEITSRPDLVSQSWGWNSNIIL